MKKGKFGYIASMKVRCGSIAFAVFLSALLVYFIGGHFFPENKTAIGILTVLICIPAAMMLVRFIMFMRFKPEEGIIYDTVEKVRGAVPAYYDCIITTPDKSYGVNVFIASDNNLLGFTDYADTDVPKLEKHLKDMFEANKYKGLNIKVFTDMEKFVSRLEALSERHEKSSDIARDGAILHLVERLSL